MKQFNLKSNGVDYYVHHEFEKDNIKYVVCSVYKKMDHSSNMRVFNLDEGALILKAPELVPGKFYSGAGHKRFQVLQLRDSDQSYILNSGSNICIPCLEDGKLFFITNEYYTVHEVT